MGTRNNTDWVIGLPDKNTGSRAGHSLNGGTFILWFIEYRLRMRFPPYSCRPSDARVRGLTTGDPTTRQDPYPREVS
jgi:hypothetical protein